MKKKWTKKTTLTAVTGAAVLGAATVALGNASSLENIFNPNRFEKYENRHKSEEYDYVAGEGGEAELADKDKDGKDGTSEEKEQQVLQVTEQERSQSEQKKVEEDDSADLGVAEPNSTDSVKDVNKNAVELKQNNSGNSSVVPSKNTTTGNGSSTGGQSGTDNNGQKSDNSGNTGKTDSKTDNGNSNNNKDNGNSNNNSDNNSGNNSNNNSNGNNGGSGDNGNTTPDTPTATPTPTPVPWEDKQLQPKDPTVTKDGTLTALEVNLRKETYAVGDSFSPEDAEVTATFSITNGSTFKKILNYGGDGYEVSLYTGNKGTYTAVFKYGGLSVRLPYQVMSNYVTLNYMALYNGECYGSFFPGEGLKDISEEDYKELVKLREFPYTFPSTGNVVDLMDIHRSADRKHF